MFLTAALSGPAVGQERASSQDAIVVPDNGGNTVHFNGTIQAGESYEVFGDPPLGFFANAGGTATTTQLGQFTLLYTFIVLFANDVPSAPGSSIYTDAHGDRFFTTAVGTPTNTPDPDVVSIVETHTITFGSGRYADAKGSFTLTRLLNLVTGATTGSFHGTIKLRGHH